MQRWTAKGRSPLVLSILRGETSAQEAARKHGLTVAEIEGWQERYLLAAENALRSRPRDEEALKDEQIKKLKQCSSVQGPSVSPSVMPWSHDAHNRSSPSFCGKLRTLAPNA